MEFFEDHDAGGKIRLSMPDDVISTAAYSECRQYRYLLRRRWAPDQPDRSLMFIMLNPSTATEDVDDPTVRKCRVYATRWGYNHLIIGNVMGYRATVPALLRDVDDPIGTDNLSHLRSAIQTYMPTVVCAWGCLPQRLIHCGAMVVDLLRELSVQPRVLRLNAGGEPGHPLYLGLDSELQLWNIGS
jgi:hypothetical protein